MAPDLTPTFEALTDSVVSKICYLRYQMKTCPDILEADFGHALRTKSSKLMAQVDDIATRAISLASRARAKGIRF